MRGERLIKEIKSIVPFQFKVRDSRKGIYIGTHGEVRISLTISPSYKYYCMITDGYGYGFGDCIKVKASEKYKIFQMIDNFYAWNKIYKST